MFILYLSTTHSFTINFFFLKTLYFSLPFEHLLQGPNPTPVLFLYWLLAKNDVYICSNLKKKILFGGHGMFIQNSDVSIHKWSLTGAQAYALVCIVSMTAFLLCCSVALQRPGLISLLSATFFLIYIFHLFPGFPPPPDSRWLKGFWHHLSSLSPAEHLRVPLELGCGWGSQHHPPRLFCPLAVSSPKELSAPLILSWPSPRCLSSASPAL